MNVYPVNLVPGTVIFSPDKANYSAVENIYHDYLKHRLWFHEGDTAVITLEWGDTNAVEADSLILGDTNAVEADIEIATGIFNEVIKEDQEEVAEPDEGLEEMEESEESEDEPVSEPESIESEPKYSLEEKIVRITINPKELDIIEIPGARKITITLRGNNLYLGYLFVGKKVVLPRFLINPSFGKDFRGGSERTEYGQSYGILKPALREVSVSYQRIPQEEKEIVEKYIESVHGIVPHVIDPYPEARHAVPPMYATLDITNWKMTKTNEAGFFWDYDLSWKEAR